MLKSKALWRKMKKACLSKKTDDITGGSEMLKAYEENVAAKTARVEFNKGTAAGIALDGSIVHL